jgi:hypothetical protein
VQPATRERRGFALALALLALIVLSMLVALVLDAAVQEMRVARGDLGAARAWAASETAVAALLASPADSALLAMPRGSAARYVRTSGGDTVVVTLQPLGGERLRAVVAVRSWAGGARADAGCVLFLRLVPDTGAHAGDLRMRRFPGWWWAPLQ